MENGSIIWQHAAHTTPTIISLLLNKSYTKKAHLLTKLLKNFFLGGKSGEWAIRIRRIRQKQQEDQAEEVDSNDSPEISDRGAENITYLYSFPLGPLSQDITQSKLFLHLKSHISGQYTQKREEGGGEGGGERQKDRDRQRDQTETYLMTWDYSPNQDTSFISLSLSLQ